MAVSGFHVRFLLAAMACCWVAACNAAEHTRLGHVTSVCAIVSNPSKYNNERVTIYADIISSFHGILAFDNACHGVVRLWVPDNKSDTEYGRTLLRSKTEPGNGFHHAYIGGIFTAPVDRDPETNVRGTVVVDELSGWLPGRRHNDKRG
jgi:hypothetical protein